MAKGRISEDQLRYTIDVNSSKAQQEVHKLERELSVLNAESRSYVNTITKIKAEGEKYPGQLKKVQAEYRKTSIAISEAKGKLAEATRAIHVNDMTMNQLRKQAKSLKAELDNTVKSLEPEKYRLLAERLSEVNQRMNNLTISAKKYKEIALDKGVFDVFIGNTMSKFADFLGSKLAQINDFIADGIEMARSADGITKAFKELDNPNLLDNLRKATKGTVNDVELMKAAVQAKDFRIPLEDLGKYLQFAQLKAQQTGQSVEYMTNSIVTGLGRKSVMILDNLGLSAAEINEQVSKTGDFMKAVGTIVEKQLSEAGNAYESASDRAAQAAVRLQNAQKELGDAMLPATEHFGNMITEIQIGFMELIKIAIEYKNTIAIVVSALFGMIVAQKAHILTTKIQTAAQITLNTTTKAFHVLLGAGRGLYLLASAAMFALTGNIKKATVVMRLFNITCKANVIGILVTAIVGAITYFGIFKEKTDEAKKAMEEIAETEKEVSSSINDQTAKVRKLNDEMRNEKLSLDRRRAALEELKRIIPEYNGLLSKEGQLTRDNKEAIDAYIESLSKQIKLKAYEEKLTALYKQKSDLEDKRDETSKQYWDTRQTNTLQGSNRSLGGKILKFFGLDSESKLEKSLSSINTSITATDDKITMLENKIKDLGDISLKTTEAATVPGSSAAGQSSSGNRNNGSSNRDSQDLDTATINDLNSRHQQSLQAWKDYYDKKKAMLEEDCISEKITKEKYDELMLGLDQLNTAAIINIERSYYNESQSLQLTEDEKKKELVESYAQYVKNAEANSNQARLNAMKAYYDNLGKINQVSADEQEMTLDQQMEAELKAVETYGEAGIAYARQFGQSEIAITEAIEKAKAAIRDKYREKKQEQDEQDQKQQEQNKENELRRETKYADEILAIKSKDWKKAAQAYKNLFSDAIYALQNAELANVEAKYDAQIEAARQAGQDTTELENKKAQEKLAIEKKYADVNFAIKASQIIADTAVSIMMAYSQLGPIAGSIAAALMGITGAAQLAAANAERERVKKMTLSGSSSSSTSGARVATGLESGGRIDVEREQDGKHFNAEYDPNRRGYIDRPTVIVGEGPTGQSKEWVASNAAVTNPTVAPIIDIIDKAQRAGTVRTLDLRKFMISQISGRQSGGTITASPVPASGAAATVPGSFAAGQPSALSPSLIQDLTTVLSSLKERGIKSYVALDDFDAQQKLRQKSRKIGSKL